VFFRWTREDTLWRLSGGESCAPAVAMGFPQLWTRLAGARYSSTGPAPDVPIANGWAADELGQFAEYLLPEGTAFSGTVSPNSDWLFNGNGSFLIQPGLATPPTSFLMAEGAMQPQWFSSNVKAGLSNIETMIVTSNFGGYAVASFNVCEVAYKERQAVYEYAGPSGSTTRQQRAVKLVGVQPVVNGKQERWTVVLSTEADTRAPYVEIRKPSGSRTRLYPRGLAVNGFNAFAYRSDGRTQHPEVNAFSVYDKGGRSPDTGAQLTGAYAGNGTSSFGVTSSTSWPAPALEGADAAFDPGKPAPGRMSDVLTGGPNSDQPGQDMRSRIFATTQFTMPPSVFNPAAGAKASESALKARGDWYDAVRDLGLDANADGDLKVLGVSVIPMDGLMAGVMGTPDFVNGFAPKLFVFVRSFTGAWMIFAAGKYCWEQFAWALGMVGFKRFVPPTARLYDEYDDQDAGDEDDTDMLRGETKYKVRQSRRGSFGALK
jgi:hypothetical protein